MQDRFLGLGSPTKQFVILCHHWFCKQKLALPPATTLKIELERNIPHMIFNARNDTSLPIVNVVDIRLWFKTLELEATISDKLSMNVMTDSYNLKVSRHQILQVTLPRGTKIYLLQLISSELPKRIMLAMVDQQAITYGQQKSKVLQTTKDSPAKSAPIDPLPTWLLKMLFHRIFCLMDHQDYHHVSGCGNTMTKA